METLFVRV